MQAAINRDYADAVTVTDISLPSLLDDSVMIEVYAASVNPVDNLIQAGYLRAMLPLQFPLTMGNDVSGIVTAVGKDVTRFKVGDAVFARPNSLQSGTFAEHAMIKAQDVAKKPTNLSHEEAASLPLVALTAWQALVTKAQLQAGQKVLIHAGSGGVGSIAIQIAKHLGAHVVATTSTDNVAMVKALGADTVIDYRTEKFDDIVKDCDVVLDTLGGVTRTQSFSVLKKGGILVSIIAPADTSGQAEKLGVRSEVFFMSANGEQLGQIGQLVEQGAIKPVVERSYPFAEVARALEQIKSGRTKGKVVVKVK